MAFHFPTSQHASSSSEAPTTSGATSLINCWKGGVANLSNCSFALLFSRGNTLSLGHHKELPSLIVNPFIWNVVVFALEKVGSKRTRPLWSDGCKLIFFHLSSVHHSLFKDIFSKKGTFCIWFCNLLRLVSRMLSASLDSSETMARLCGR